MATLPKGKLEAKLKEEHDLISQGVLRQENPLDESEEFDRFLIACRRGDLKECHSLISAGVNINGKDVFDYTPLILASLCGHYEVVQLLLESGASAERDTFQGERCLYNALNDRIRNLLQQYDYSKSSDPLQPWSSHITSLLSLQSPKTSDITLIVGGAGGGGFTYTASTAASKSFQLHKFFLAARTPYFFKKLTDAPELHTWRFSASQVPPEALDLVMRYLYLEDLQTAKTSMALAGLSSSSDSNSRADDAESLLFRGIDRLCKNLQVENLWEAILAGSDRRLTRQRHQDEVQRAQQQVAAFFHQQVLGNRVVVETSKVDDVKWPQDNFIFADCLLRADEGEGEEEEIEKGETVGADDEATDKAAKEHGDGRSGGGGIPVGPTASKTEDAWRALLPSSLSPPLSPKKSVLYPVHKALLVRSDYFRTMFSSAFLESQASPHLRITTMDCSPEVLEIILSFLYSEQADIPLALALDVLYMADMLFLDKLKTKAAVVISTEGMGITKGQVGGSGPDARDDIVAPDLNIYDVLHAAWELRIQRLEDFAARFLASQLEHYIDNEAFAELVLESAQRLQSRQETDSIELIDDIRYFLSERFRMRFEDVDLSGMLGGTEGKEEMIEGKEDGGATESQQTGDHGVYGVQNNHGVPGHQDDKGSNYDDEQDNQDKVLKAQDRDTAGEPEHRGPVIRDLDGNVVEDEFDSDALNYQILLNKIDKLLERLGLDG